ncbi:MAG: Rossman fold protein family [Acidimicrobiia bacterium]|nr:Rossman fold protein family [Acidimicrobiia bacterium]
MSTARVCVFCGSRPGINPEFAIVARRLGRTLAERHIGLVYGGASVGLMGVVADAALEAGGEVIGVIPRGVLRSEVGHAGITDLRVVGSMHERKALMAELSDGFIALPGGLGTFEELFEQLTWAYLGISAKPIVALDVAGFFQPLFALLDHADAGGFLGAGATDLITRAQSVDEALAALALAPESQLWEPKASDSR